MTVSDPVLSVFDAWEPEHHADPYPVYRRMRDQGGLVPFLLDDVPVTLVTRYEECAAVLTGSDWGHGYSAGISPFRDPSAAIPGSFVRMDPPDHGRLRSLVNKAFTPRMVARFLPVVQERVDLLVDAAVERGRAEVLADFAVPLAVAMVPGALLGAPESDGPDLRRWQLAIARGSDPDHLLPADAIAARGTAAQECMAYLHALIERRRTSRTDDLLSMLLHVEDQGDVLKQHEVLGISLLTLVAGMETTINLIGNGLHALLRHPDQLALLRADPSLVPSAIDEMLRYDAPTQFTIRVALAETKVGDRTFRRGDGVVVLTASASRDERAFDRADEFDVTRYAGNRPARRHLGFSLGLHYCVGAPLARIEAETLLSRLIRHDLTLTDTVPTYQPSLIHRGLVELPITIA
ncbi:cytochrome P450 [Actinosynnema sp. NPDC020468]|uniref:cytochrome P450 n=1 Tax=Actinosynnema sp. NPDC020468 TaxID=3154488 RepID=UPI0033DADB81